MNGKRTIVYLHQRAPGAALESLKRLTGLRFTQWPESLVEHAEVPEKARQPGLDELLPKPKKASS